jgi:hypothetical protein
MSQENPNITFFIATTGRKTLANTLRSLYGQFGHGLDVIEVFFDGPNFTEVGPEFFQPEQDLYGNDLKFHVLTENLGCYGHGVRNAYQGTFQSDYIHHMDDDDMYCPDVIPSVRSDMKTFYGKLLIYKFRAHGGGITGGTNNFTCGFVGTPAGLIPNRPEIFGRWVEAYGGDAEFYTQTRDKIGWNNVVYRDRKIVLTRPHVYGYT